MHFHFDGGFSEISEKYHADRVERSMARNLLRISILITGKECGVFLTTLLFITTAVETGFPKEKAKLESFGSCKER